MARELTEEMLDKVIAGRRGMNIPAGPPAGLVAATVQRLEAADGARANRWRMSMVRTALATAAGLILVAGVLFALLGRSRVVFADVIDSVKSATCVHFWMTGKVAQPNGAALDLKAEVWITQTGRMRQEMDMQSGKMVMIQDPKEGKMLMLVPGAHQATVLEMANAPAQVQPHEPAVPGPHNVLETANAPAQAQGNFLEQIKSLDAKSATAVGAKEVAGHKTEGFKVTTPAMDMTVWADVETHLPVEVEQTMRVGFLPEATVTLKDFVWNAEVDPALLSLTPPEGYTVQTMKMNMAAAGEKDLLEALKAAAQLNGGRYPDTFDVAGVSGALGKSMAEAVVKNHWQMGSPEFKALQQKNADAMAVVSRGWLFVGDAKNGDAWWYAGKDVEAGKAGVAIMWYRPQGATTYHVIDADLSVHEVREDGLPTMPSTRMGPAAGTSPAGK